MKKVRWKPYRINHLSWWKEELPSEEEMEEGRMNLQKHDYFEEMGQQASAGWQREKLLMVEYGIWDAAAFGCSMNTLIGIKTSKYEEFYNNAK